jgi:undecaprenyl pyrophosphate synthase
VRGVKTFVKNNYHEPDFLEKLDKLTPKTFRDYLDTAKLPLPEVIVRTG